MSNSGDAMSHGRIIDAVSQSLQPPHYTNKVAQIAFTLKPIGQLPHSLVCDDGISIAFFGLCDMN